MPILANTKWELFAQQVARGISAQEAYEKAGYAPAKSNARKLKNNPEVRKRVEEIVSLRASKNDKAIARAAERSGIQVEYVLRELASIGFSNIADYLDMSSGEPRLSLVGVPRERLAAISSIEVESKFAGRGAKRAEIGTVTKIRLWPKEQALVDIGRHLGMFADRLTGENRAPALTVVVDDARQFILGELARLAERKRAIGGPGGSDE